MPRRGENVDKKKMIESKGFQEGGKEEFIKRKSLRTGVLKTRRRQGEGSKSFKAWLAKTKRGGGVTT